MDTETIFKTTERFQPIPLLLDIAEAVDPSSWVLVGGLMVQMHASMGGLESRATKDVDLLIDVLSPSSSIKGVVRSLAKLGFEAQEPGLRGSAFHRMRKGQYVVDLLVADHLPTRKQQATHVNRWPVMEIPGGAQAIDRKMPVTIEAETRRSIVYIPDLLGALILKCAAYSADRRNRERHLDDAALLAALITNHATEQKRLHGSDKKRIRAAAAALENPNSPSWLLLPQELRLRGQYTLRILSA